MKFKNCIKKLENKYLELDNMDVEIDIVKPSFSWGKCFTVKAKGEYSIKPDFYVFLFRRVFNFIAIFYKFGIGNNMFMNIPLNEDTRLEFRPFDINLKFVGKVLGITKGILKDIGYRNHILDYLFNSDLFNENHRAFSHFAGSPIWLEYIDKNYVKDFLNRIKGTGEFDRMTSFIKSILNFIDLSEQEYKYMAEKFNECGYDVSINNKFNAKPAPKLGEYNKENNEIDEK